MKKLKALILAAGKGTRMESDLPKVLHTVDGKPMVHYSIQAAKDAGASEVCCIIGYKNELVKRSVFDIVSFAIQTEQLGTGHAVMCAKDFIESGTDTLILCGDTPLITGKSLSALYEKHKKESNGVTVMSAILEDPKGYGRIIRNENGAFMAITEDKDCTEAERETREVNAGIYLFNSDALLASLSLIKNDNAQGEYYLTDTVGIIRRTGLRVDAMPVEDEDEIRGVNTVAQLQEAEEIMRRRLSQVKGMETPSDLNRDDAAEPDYIPADV